MELPPITEEVILSLFVARSQTILTLNFPLRITYGTAKSDIPANPVYVNSLLAVPDTESGQHSFPVRINPIAGR